MAGTIQSGTLAAKELLKEDNYSSAIAFGKPSTPLIFAMGLTGAVNARSERTNKRVVTTSILQKESNLVSYLAFGKMRLEFAQVYILTMILYLRIILTDVVHLSIMLYSARSPVHCTSDRVLYLAMTT